MVKGVGFKGVTELVRGKSRKRCFESWKFMYKKLNSGPHTL